MKLTNQNKIDLQTLIRHTLDDIAYGEGGTYNCTDPEDQDSCDNIFDEKSAERANRAIQLIKKLIAENE